MSDRLGAFDEKLFPQFSEDHVYRSKPELYQAHLLDQYKQALR